MWVCNDCGRVFPKPRIIRDMCGWDGESDDYVCPFCGSDDFGSYSEDAELPEKINQKISKKTL